MTNKPLLRTLAGEVLDTPPVWMMRQAGRYLPEYRKTREKAGSFLNLCYTPELAAEVTLQPIRRYGFDAAILFADILLVPQALGSDLTFNEGEGPVLSKITNAAQTRHLRPAADVHAVLGPIYETVRILRGELPKDCALIGFAGAPWTVASYMIAGRGTPDQAPARQLLYQDPETFFGLLNLISDATAEYLCGQIEAGAEAIKLFDSWAGTVPGGFFGACCVDPVNRILMAVRNRYPHIPVIGFPRGCGSNYPAFANATGVQGLALDTAVDPAWATANLPKDLCLQGNLDPLLLETGGSALAGNSRRICRAFSGRPHVFNLGHGISPQADPDNVSRMLEVIRS